MNSPKFLRRLGIFLVIVSLTGCSVYAVTPQPPPAQPNQPPQQPEQPLPQPGQPGQPQPGQPQPGLPGPEQPQPGQLQPGQPEPGQPQPGQPQPGQPEPGQPQPPTPGQPPAPTDTQSNNRAAVEPLLPQLATANWYGWQNLGRAEGNNVNEPVIGQYQDGHLGIFAWVSSSSFSSNENIYANEQSAVNGSSWGSWGNFGAQEGEDGISGPAVVTNSAGKMYVFAMAHVTTLPGCGYSYATKYIYQTTSFTGWSAWGNLGTPSGACYVLEPQIGVNSDGRLDVLAVGEGGNLYHRWQTSTSDVWVTGWTSLGHPPGTTLYPGRVAVNNNADGRLAVFALGDDYQLYHIWQNTATNLSSWSAWTGFGKPGGVNLTVPVMERNQDGRLNVFSAGIDGNLYHKWQVAPNSFWSAWENLGKPSTGSIYDPKVSRTGDGRLVVVASGNDGAFHSIAQVQANGFWGSWTSLGKPTGDSFSSNSAIARNQNGTMVVAAVDSSGRLWWNYERLQVFLPLIRK